MRIALPAAYTVKKNDSGEHYFLSRYPEQTLQTHAANSALFLTIWRYRCRTKRSNRSIEFRIIDYAVEYHLP
jgi:hypothetical protein